MVAVPSVAEADDLAAHVDDGEHDAVAEPVVAFTVVARDHQAGLGQCVALVIRERGGKVLPAVRRVADAEFCGDFTAQPAPLEVINGALRLLELLAVIARGGLRHLIQIRRDFLGVFSLGISRCGTFVRHIQADAARQFFDCIDIAEPGMLHDEADRRAMRAAAEAMIKLLSLADGKRGGFFVVERATGDEIRAGLLERHVALDHIDDIEAIKQVLNEALWNHARAFHPKNGNSSTKNTKGTK